jgi:hypothetical protein
LALVNVELARALMRAVGSRATMQSVRSLLDLWWLVSVKRGIRAVIVFGALALGGCASALNDQPAFWAFTPQGKYARNGGAAARAGDQ